MKAVALKRYLPIDNPESLLDVVIDDPVPTGRDLLVEVKAVAVNPVDYKIRSPKDQVELQPKVLGWDVAGVVRAVGSEATLFKPGDEVYYAGSITRPGANSELHIADERIVGRKPRNIGFAEAAALPLTTITAWEALFDRLRISKEGVDVGKSLLVIGGAGGVGSIAIQLAKRLAKLNVIATASRPESEKWVRELGADHVVDHNKPLAGELKRIGVPEVDYVLIATALEPYFPQLAEIVKPQGAVSLIVSPTKPVDLGPLMSKSISVAWELMFTRSMFGTSDMIEQHKLLNATAELVEQGVVKTTVAQHYGKVTALNLRKAHETLEGGRAIGKIVLEGF
jgi:NADPH:quinone reductase